MTASSSKNDDDAAKVANVKNGNGGGNDNDDLEALSAKACALASASVPNYSDIFKIKNELSHAEWGNRYNMDDDEDDAEDANCGAGDDGGEDDDEEELSDDEAPVGKFDAQDSSGMVLAEKTASILSNFQDYVSGIGVGGEGYGEGYSYGDGGEHDGPKLTASEAILKRTNNSVADGIRGDGKAQYLMGVNNNNATTDGSTNKSTLTREWNYNDSGLQNIINGVTANRNRRRGSNASSNKSGESSTWNNNIIHNGSNIKNLRSLPLGHDWETGGDPESCNLSDYNHDEDNFAMLGRGQRYVHPALRSNRVKRCLASCLVIALAVVIGASVGFSRSSATVDQQQQHGGDADDDGKSKALGDKIDEFELSNRSSPSDRPRVDGGLPLGIVDNPADGVLTPEENGAYENALDRYRPRTYDRGSGWGGRTYPDAVEFCSSLHPGESSGSSSSGGGGGGGGVYSVCPYEAICPVGSGRQPVGGYRNGNGNGGEWQPIGDAYNDWVQLGRDGACTRYSYETAHTPDWGLTGGDGGGNVVSRIMCCVSYDDNHRADDDDLYLAMRVHVDDPNYDRYAAVANKYHPLEYDRPVWSGQTYADALDFCGDIDGYGVCTYDAICPMGGDSMPFGGYRGRAVDGDGADGTDGEETRTADILQVEGMSWIPILAGGGSEGVGGGDWVQVGPHDPCIRYSGEHPDQPAWSSATGVDDEGEEVTRHIVCCRLVADDEAALYAIGALSPDGNDNNEHYAAIEREYLPKMYHRGDGYDGRTYARARSFCREKSSSKMDDDREYGICPYEAICPDGPDAMPLGGYRDGGGAGGQMWMPIGDVDNDWVQVASVGPSCVRFSGMNPSLPDWGVTGEGSEGITRYVACCVVVVTPPTTDHGDGAIESQSAEYVMGNTVLARDKVDVDDADRYEMYAFAASLFRPIGADRDDGWEGRTYDEAYRYCGGLDRIICPYEAVCPLGPGYEPIGGYHSDGGEDGTWIPVSPTGGSGGGGASSAENWAKISKDGACVTYYEEHGKYPEWGVTGEDSEDMTRHVICCDEPTEARAKEGEEAEEGMLEDAIVMADFHAMDEALQSDVSRYDPHMYSRTSGWQGKTYLEAIRFCSGRRGYHICPVEAICPLAKHPAFLPEGDIEELWLPVSNGMNEWVGMLEDEPCVPYDNVHAGPPEWGITGEGSEGITAYIMCCLGSADGGAESNFIYEHDEDVNRPAHYDRSQGWNGRTRQDAQAFCDQRGMKLCTLDAICPLAFSGDPYGGRKDDPVNQWTPFDDNSNDFDSWVSIGSDNTCQIYDHLFGGPPQWDLTGENVDDMTRHVMCCSKSGAEKKPASPALSGGTQEELQDKAKIEAEFNSLGEALDTDITRYDPLIYDRANGWEGKTYLEAIDFCTGKEGYHICPVEAICPLAKTPEFFGETGFMLGKSWLPVSDDKNQWVSILEDESCIRYTNMHAGPPEWGITGVGSEDITTHVMCCLGSIGGDGEVDFIIEQDVDANHPALYDRAKGWDGRTHQDAQAFCSEKQMSLCTLDAICPLGLSGDPYGGRKDDPVSQWMPFNNFDGSDSWVSVGTEGTCEVEDIARGEPPHWLINGKPKEEVTRNVMCCSKSLLSEGIQENFQPLVYHQKDGWHGRSYADAVIFCASIQDQDYALCPYHALCPSGGVSGAVPEVGFVDAWIPIYDNANDWVSLTSQSSCNLWSSTFPSKPEWGLTGNGGEEFTNSLVCCKGSVKGSAGEDLVYSTVASSSRPITFGRENGWKGQTYEESVGFCNKRGMKLCRYNEICPLSHYDSPIGKVKDESIAWVATSGTSNGWVSAGTSNTCLTYEQIHGEGPSWGLTGIDSEAMTRHIKCCVDEDGNDISPATNPQANPPSSKPTPPPTPLPTVQSPPPASPPTSPEIEGGSSGNKYDPVWYDRSSGWTGQTFDDASMFCSEKGSNHDICPYEKICPGGSLSAPFGGIKVEPRGSWAPINAPFNSWVQVSDGQSCVRYERLNPDDHPDWGVTGVGSEEITRHIACCNMDYIDEDAPQTSDIYLNYKTIEELYSPKWFNRDEGWVGTTYIDAIAFCATQNSYIPCPLEAYCPEGGGSVPTGGYDGTEEAYAPIMDIPNGWVQIGRYTLDSTPNSCRTYNSLHDTPPLWGITGETDKDLIPHIMCCKEPPNGIIGHIETIPSPIGSANTKVEQEILEEKHPVWFSRDHGYHGKTWSLGSDFCKAIGDMTLCPASAYCPGEDGKIFLQKDPFPGDQLAPVASESDTREEYWVSIGDTLDLCSTHAESKLLSLDWASDGSEKKKEKNHILCCQNPKYSAKEARLKNNLSPVWLSTEFGWNGGSHADAMAFCENFDNRRLCPYTAYCPHGPGHPPMGGHKTDLNTEGEQWAPLYGEENRWVMIGQKHSNSATTCMDSYELEGELPIWGLSDKNPGQKKYIMCCDF